MDNKVSIIIPCFNEEENIGHLTVEIYKNINISIFEVLIINDDSSDNTKQKVELLRRKYSNLKIFNNNYNIGQSLSIIKGIKLSNYPNILTLDGDGQNDPADIPIMLDEYFIGEYDLVAGIRKNRKDNLIKIFSSRIANKIRSLILNDDCEDTGCSLKIFKKKIFLIFPEFNGIHRFIPALFKSNKSKIKFLTVHHRKREYGNSNYGTIDRLFKGIFDIFRVLKIIKFIKKNV